MIVIFIDGKLSYLTVGATRHEKGFLLTFNIERRTLNGIFDLRTGP